MTDIFTSGIIEDEYGAEYGPQYLMVNGTYSNGEILMTGTALRRIRILGIMASSDSVAGASFWLEDTAGTRMTNTISLKAWDPRSYFPPVPYAVGPDSLIGHGLVLRTINGPASISMTVTYIKH